MSNTEYYCNACGKKIKTKGQILQEDILHIEKTWGYFSKKDGKHHTFRLCETCYDQLIKSFVLPIEIHDKHELL